MNRPLIVILASLALPALAQELPEFRKGLWEFNRVVAAGGEPQTLTSRRCVNPTEEIRQQNAMLEQVGCKASTITRSGDAYSFGADCNVDGVAMQSKSTIMVESDSAYRVEVESKQGPQATKETLVARRIGDC